MFENSSATQLSILSLLVGMLTIGSFVYIFSLQPSSLKMSRNGVPFFTADVIHPDTGKSISVDELVRHYKEGNY